MAYDLLFGKPNKRNWARQPSTSMGFLPYGSQQQPGIVVIKQTSWWPGLIPLALGAWIVTKVVKHTK